MEITRYTSFQTSRYTIWDLETGDLLVAPDLVEAMLGDMHLVRIRPAQWHHTLLAQLDGHLDQTKTT